MDTDAKNKRQNEKAEDELIRHLLLQAAEEYREVLAKAPPAPRHSRAYRRWEKRFLRDPFSVLEEPGGSRRLSFPKPFQTAASLLLVLVCAFVLMLGMNPGAGRCGGKTGVCLPDGNAGDQRHSPAQWERRLGLYQ